MHTHHFCLSLDEMIPERLRLLRKAWVSREMTELRISSSLQLVPHGNTWSERQNLHKNKRTFIELPPCASNAEKSSCTAVVEGIYIRF